MDVHETYTSDPLWDIKFWSQKVIGHGNGGGITRAETALHGGDINYSTLRVMLEFLVLGLKPPLPHEVRRQGRSQKFVLGRYKSSLGR